MGSRLHRIKCSCDGTKEGAASAAHPTSTRRRKYRICGPWQQEDGQELVEYALVLPIFLLLILGTIEFGILFFQYNVVANAAREAARAGIYPATEECDLGCLEGEIRAAAADLLAGVDESLIDVDITYPTSSSVRVAVAYEAHLLSGPMIEVAGFDSVITLRSVATMQRE